MTKAKIVLALLISFNALAAPSHAQGLDSEKAIRTIIGSPVKEEEERAAADPRRVVKAIEQAAQSAAEVRKTSKVAQVDIVFLPDLAEETPPAIGKAIDAHERDIAALRQEVEGNALLYHAIDSRSVLMRDVVAVEFDDRNRAIIYAAARPAAP